MSYIEKLESVLSTIAAGATEADRGNFPTASIDALRTAGLLGIGQSDGLAAAAAVVERLARVCGSTAMIATMHYAASAVIAAHGPAEIVQAIAAGTHLTTLAFSEPGSRSHFWAALGTATIDPAGVRIASKKSWVTSASQELTAVPRGLASARW